MLEINNLRVTIDGKEVIKGLSLTINPNEKVALMGRNGCGKTSLSKVIMGHPDYQITAGTIKFLGQDITELKVEERAKLGIFLGFQHPEEISGVSVTEFLRISYNNITKSKINILQFDQLLTENMKQLKIPSEFKHRYLNEGFSGGEKKKTETLQLLLLKPAIAILDETDSGLDIDALKAVSDGINLMKDTGILLITHYSRILNYVKPDRVLIMQDGKIVKEGDINLAKELEDKGYDLINGIQVV